MKDKVKNRVTIQKEQESRLKTAVIGLLNWSELDFGNFQFDSGMEYLQVFIPEEWVKEMSSHKIFWSWWRNHWTRRDEVFVGLATNLNLKSRIKLYHNIHNGKMLTESIFPNSVVLAGSNIIKNSKRILEKK